MRYQVGPLRALAPVAVGCLHEFEVRGVPVRADHPTIAEMVGAVFKIPLAGRDDAQSTRPATIHTAVLVGNGAVQDDANILLGAGEIETDVEAVVGFLIYQLISGRGAA